MILKQSGTLQTARIQDGARSAEEITRVYYSHIDTVYRVCFSFMGNKQDAQDAAQAVFIKYMKSKQIFSDTEHEKAWLITASKNQCRDLHRQWWRKKVVMYDQLPEAAGEDSGSDDAVTDSLLRLPAKYRIVLYLFYYEAYRLSEIADMLSLNVNTVKTRIKTAKKLLKMELEVELND